MEQQTVTSYVKPRPGSVLILRPSIQGAHANLKRWLAQQGDAATIVVWAQDDATRLGQAVEPRRVYSVLTSRKGQGMHPLAGLWLRLRSLLAQFDTVVVLCVGDDEVRTGYTLYRILGEYLFPNHVVLIGPHAVHVWPGGRRAFTFEHIRELATIVGAAAIASLMMAVAYAAIVLQEVLVRARILR